MNPLIKGQLLEGLNPEQRRAVQTTEGPLLILAGAGSGKTRVLTRRVAYLLANGVPPWNILAVTFTNKAAAEMKSRVEDQAGHQGNRVMVTTFHSACMRFLRRDIERLGYNRNFTIYDDDDQIRLLKQVSGDLGINAEKYTPARLRYQIDRAKNRLLTPEALAQAPVDQQLDLTDPTPKVYAAYQRHLKAASAVDFNDLLNLVVELWRDHPEVLASYQDRFRYLMVDEYQDTNHAQYQLVRLLSQRDRNVAVVGDDDQSIYSFRGADIRNILDFEKDFPEAAIIRLERNYRSTRNILDVANAVVRNNTERMDKEMTTEAAEGAAVRLMAEQDEGEEANAVLREVRSLQREGFKLGEIALIYRTNAASRAFESVFVAARVPYILVGARRFFERKEVKDILAYVKLILNPADDMAFLRAIGAPVRGVGPKAIESIRNEAADAGGPMLVGLKRWAEGGGKARAGGAAFLGLHERLTAMALAVPAEELMRAVIEESGYADSLRKDGTPEAQGRLDNLDELVRAVERGINLVDESDPERPDAANQPMEGISQLQQFVDRAALTAGSDDLPDGDGQLTLLTSHLAKGLEFRAVFVTGLYEGGFPHFRSLQMERDIEEERRLVYVAFTRARERLYLTRPRFRLSFDGKGPPRRQPVEPSRFLREVPINLLQGSSVKRQPEYGFGSSASKGAQFPINSRAPVRPAPPQTLPMFGSADLEPGERTMIPESMDAFQVGTRVLHPQFGRGVIRGRDGPPNNLRLNVTFERYGSKSLFARQARLEILM